MACGHPCDDDAWSKRDAGVAIVAMAAAALAWTVALRPARFSTPAFALAWLVAVGGLCVIAHARIPAPVRAVLLAGVCGSLLTCVATRDVLGLHHVEMRTVATLADAEIGDWPGPRAGSIGESGDARAIAGPPAGLSIRVQARVTTATAPAAP